MQLVLMLGKCTLHLHVQAECEGLNHGGMIFQKKYHSISLENNQKTVLVRGVNIPLCDGKHGNYAQSQCIADIATTLHHYSQDTSNMHHYFPYSSNTLSDLENSLNHHAKGAHPSRFGDS